MPVWSKYHISGAKSHLERACGDSGRGRRTGGELAVGERAPSSSFIYAEIEDGIIRRADKSIRYLEMPNKNYARVKTCPGNSFRQNVQLSGNFI